MMRKGAREEKGATAGRDKRKRDNEELRAVTRKNTAEREKGRE